MYVTVRSYPNDYACAEVFRTIVLNNYNETVVFVSILMS